MEVVGYFDARDTCLLNYTHHFLKDCNLLTTAVRIWNLTLMYFTLMLLLWMVSIEWCYWLSDLRIQFCGNSERHIADCPWFVTVGQMFLMFDHFSGYWHVYWGKMIKARHTLLKLLALKHLMPYIPVGLIPCCALYSVCTCYSSESKSSFIGI
jgi:hypothetical protein